MSSNALSPRSPPSQSPSPKLIGDLPYASLKRLADRIDIPGEGNWRELIRVLPGTAYDQATVERFGLNANRVGGSPGYALLTDLSNRGIGYDVLVTGLKKLHFGAALHDLGYREEVKFKVQPVATPAIEDQKVELSCEATGVPMPSYLWFKGRTPLPDQVSNVLVIERVHKTDAAMYTCRASNDVNTLFSNWAEIIVQKPPVLRSQAVPGSHQKVTEIPQLLQCPGTHIEVNADHKLQLTVLATVPSGAHLSYQWFRDSKLLEFGTGPELLVPHAHITDGGNYNCRVTSDLGGSILTSNCQVTVRPSQYGPPRGVQTPAGNPPNNQGIPPDIYGGGQQSQVINPNVGTFDLQADQDFPIAGYPQVSPADYIAMGYGSVMGNYEQWVGPEQFIPPVGVVEDRPGGQGEQPDLYDKCYDKVALLVGNKDYRMKELLLNTPDRDAQDLAGVLQSAGFKVVSLTDLSKLEMEKAADFFASLIGKNVYALFFFAGHGFEHNSLNYMMPVDADVEKKPEQCICAQEVLRSMQMAGAKLSIMILDMCRVSASSSQYNTPMDNCPQLNFDPPSGVTGYFLLAFSCTRAERAYEAGTVADALKEQDKNNSIFVSALKEHLQSGTLDERLDTLLSDAAAGVRDRGRHLNTSANGWMRPEIRHNMAGPLSLADEIKRGTEADLQREERALLWRNAHIVPDSIVLGCHGSESGAKPSELALRLHFEAEHSNVLIVTVELLSGCLTQVEVHEMNLCLLFEGVPHHPKLKASDFDKEYRFSESGVYGADHVPRPNDLLHFKIPGIQKIRSPTVTLQIEVHYTIWRVGKPRFRRQAVLTHNLAPPLYAKVMVHRQSPSSTSAYGARYHGNM